MRELDLKVVAQWVNENIGEFHQKKIRALKNLTLRKLLKKKNPYLFRVKNITLAQELIEELVDAYLSSSEEKMFGDFLENLAIFVASQTCDGWKSSAQGIDLEFENEGVRYLVSIKSGVNWGNSSQHKQLERDFNNALRVVRQSNQTINVDAVLGICYGSARTSRVRNYLKVVGQSFWYFISGNKDLYTDIIEPLGYRAKEHNNAYLEQKNRILNELVRDFLNNYYKDGEIDWRSIVELNCGNLTSKREAEQVQESEEN